MFANLPAVSDNLTLYFAEIRKFDLLTEEQEHALAVEFYEKKDIQSAHRLVTSNLRFVVKVASEYRHYGLRMLDLIQEGNIGLMMAVRKFNPFRGIRLISYAVWWIRAYIQNYIVSAWSLVKIGTTQAQRKLFYRLRKTKEELFKMTGDAGDTAELAEILQVSSRDVADMEQRLKGEVSLDAEIVNADGMTALETIADDRMNQEELLSEREQDSQLKQHLAKALEELNEKERYIVEQRIISELPRTLQEIADHFSISRERVRQIEEKTLKKLRKFFAPVLLCPVDGQ